MLMYALGLEFSYSRVGVTDLAWYVKRTSSVVALNLRNAYLNECKSLVIIMEGIFSLVTYNSFNSYRQDVWHTLCEVFLGTWLIIVLLFKSYIYIVPADWCHGSLLRGLKRYGGCVVSAPEVQPKWGWSCELRVMLLRWVRSRSDGAWDWGLNAKCAELQASKTRFGPVLLSLSRLFSSPLL